MKTALCISGQMRTFRSCYDSIYKNILLPLKPDVFIHTWAKAGMSNKHENNDSTDDVIVSEKILQDLYEAKKIVIEKFSNNYIDEIQGISVPEVLKNNEPVHYKGSLPMYYKIYVCNKLKSEYEAENNFTYDKVIRLRPDLSVNQPIPEYVLNENRSLWHADYMINKEIHISDKFSVGTSEIIDYYSSVFEKLNEYWMKPLGDPECRKNHRVGERLMKYHMSVSGIAVNHFHVECKLLREDTVRESSFFDYFVSAMKLRFSK